jgi:hypothetical protein
MKIRLHLFTLSLLLITAFKDLHAQDDLINGREYHRYTIFFTRGMPYFKIDSLTIGSVEFDGKKYEDIPLLYDQVMDDIVINNYDKSQMVRLVRPRVKRFSVMGSSFININNRYLEVLYEGKIQVYKKDKKEIKDDIRMGLDVQKVVNSSVNYYLYKNGKPVTVSSVNSLIGAIGDKQEELLQFAKKNRRKYRDAGADVALTEIAAYYDQLAK